MTPGVYAIRNERTGRLYIGSSWRIEQRWREHRRDLNAGRHHCSALLQAWQDDGEAAFTFVVLAREADRFKRIALELQLIQQATEPYNTSTRTCTGPRQGFKQTPEAIEKIRRANTGLKRSSETKAKLSALRKGKKFPAHAAALTGRKASAETREKMRAAHLGQVFSVSTRRKISRAHTGRTFTPGWKAKISAAKRGVPRIRFSGAAHDWFTLWERAS